MQESELPTLNSWEQNCLPKTREPVTKDEEVTIAGGRHSGTINRLVLGPPWLPMLRKYHAELANLERLLDGDEVKSSRLRVGSKELHEMY